jgi:hypothetical protein
MIVNFIYLHLVAGWSAILFSFLTGAVVGLFFHGEDWAGGYSSFRRRMLRLAHISFFGLGTINILFGLTLGTLDLVIQFQTLTSAGLIVAVITMPACCFLAAWKRPFRLLFPIPVTAALLGILPLLSALYTR